MGAEREQVPIRVKAASGGSAEDETAGGGAQRGRLRPNTWPLPSTSFLEWNPVVRLLGSCFCIENLWGKF